MTPTKSRAQGLYPEAVERTYFDAPCDYDPIIHSLTWEEFTALQHALGDWTEQPDSVCPHIVSSDEGTSYCRLAEKTADLLAKLRA